MGADDVNVNSSGAVDLLDPYVVISTKDLVGYVQVLKLVIEADLICPQQMRSPSIIKSS